MAVRFLIEWVSDGEAEARRYLADHAEPDGASLIDTRGPDVIGYVAIVWGSNYAGFRSRGIPLVHQIVVAGPFLQRGVATLLMDAAEQLVRDWGIVALGTCRPVRRVWPVQRLYGLEGTVQRYDGDQVTVLFDEHGYRDLLVPLVIQRRLLTAA